MTEFDSEVVDSSSERVKGQGPTYRYLYLPVRPITGIINRNVIDNN